MKEYEVTIESMNPCGGEQFAQREIREIETDDPIAWVHRLQTPEVPENGHTPKAYIWCSHPFLP